MSHPGRDLQPRGHRQMAPSRPTLGPGKEQGWGAGGRGGPDSASSIHEFTTCRAVMPKSNRAWKRVSCKGRMGKLEAPVSNSLRGERKGWKPPVCWGRFLLDLASLGLGCSEHRTVASPVCFPLELGPHVLGAQHSSPSTC